VLATTIFASLNPILKKIFQASFFFFLLTACSNSADNHRQEVKTRSDSLWDEVMMGHDEAMAKMGKIHQAETKLRQAIDSISKLPANLQKTVVPYKIKLDSILYRLKYADYAMKRWMEEFNTDSALDNIQKRVQYLESEKLKISKVKETMVSGLRKADSLLNK
jgi:hypothetical protein